MAQKAALTLILSWACAAQAWINPYIINGEPTSGARWPYMVAIQYGGQSICGGTHIGNGRVLTAAHCMVRAASQLQIAIDSDQDGKVDRHFPVIAWQQNARFNPNTYQNDLAVMVVDLQGYPLANAAIVTPSLLSSWQSNQINASVIGWGKTNSGAASDVLLQTTVALQIASTCQQWLGSAFDQTNMLCAGSLASGVVQNDACQGDSGGPLLVGDTLVGVVSWGNGCGRMAGVYARVDQTLPSVDGIRLERSLDFGAVPANQRVTRQLVIYNGTTGDVSVTKQDVSAGFSVDDSQCASLAVSAHCVVKIISERGNFIRGSKTGSVRFAVAGLNASQQTRTVQLRASSGYFDQPSQVAGRSYYGSTEVGAVFDNSNTVQADQSDAFATSGWFYDVVAGQRGDWLLVDIDLATVSGKQWLQITRNGKTIAQYSGGYSGPLAVYVGQGEHTVLFELLNTADASGSMRVSNPRWVSDGYRWQSINTRTITEPERRAKTGLLSLPPMLGLLLLLSLFRLPDWRVKQATQFRNTFDI